MITETTRITRTGELTISGPLEDVFQLFTPAGENDWIPTWHYTSIYPESGETVRDMVFRTEADTTWTLARYDPPHVSTYVYMNADVVVRIEVQCRAISATQTGVKISYVLTALSEAGHKKLVEQTAEAFRRRMESWKQWLDDLSRRRGWLK